MLLPPPTQDFKITSLQKQIQQPQISLNAHQQANTAERTFTVKGVAFKMIYVEGGSFMMGAPDYDSEAAEIEKPAHRVSLDGYYIAETQVTQELWYEVMGDNPSDFKGNAQRPVDSVSWNDCQEFINKLNQHTGQKFSLPTEAQWEYAARGGKKSKGYKYAGGNDLSRVAYYNGNSNSETHPVRQKLPNELGLYDMTGNVWEWCRDWYDDDYYASSPQHNPEGPTSGSLRVLRGGSWISDSRGCRLFCRRHCAPDGRSRSHGLRLVLPV
jgi:formylglycine-generating enzyme required for sulfatase activity